MGKDQHRSRSHRSHRSSRDRNGHHASAKEVPVARPHMPPGNGKPVVAELAKPSWPPSSSKRRRRSYRFSHLSRTLQGLIVGGLALACMAGGWYGIHVLFHGNKDQQRTRNTEQVAQAQPAEPTPPPPALTKFDPTRPPPPPKVGDDSADESTPKTETPPAETKTEAPKPPETMEAPKPPETKMEAPKPPTEMTKPEPPKPPENVPAVFFKEDILPIFEVKCNDCHGGGGKRPQGMFNGTTVAAMLKNTSEDEPGLVPGQPQKSRLWIRIVDNDSPMPPKDKPQLTEAEKQKILNWIKGGARESKAAAAAVAPRPLQELTAFVPPAFAANHRPLPPSQRYLLGWNTLVAALTRPE